MNARPLDFTMKDMKVHEEELFPLRVIRSQDLAAAEGGW